MPLSLLFSYASPFIAAFLAAALSYHFSIRSRKFDLLYQQKIPAVKELASKIIQLKKFCHGRVAYYEGSEFAPFYEEKPGVLHYRNVIAASYEEHAVFLSKKGRSSVDEIIEQLVFLCNAEICVLSGEESKGLIKEYERIASLCECAVEQLYKELNLKDKFSFRK